MDKIPRRKHQAVVAGRKYGRLTVLKKASDSRFGHPRHRCRCTCGRTCVVQDSNLKSGNTRSCGCLQREIVRIASVTHGASYTPEHVAWRSMIARCTIPSSTSFRYYGGRGIKVCKHWLRSFLAFLASVGRRPSAKHSLERLDNNKGYFPSNVKWTLRSLQSTNRRSCRYLTMNGRTQTMAAWAKEIGISDTTLRYRKLKMGMTDREALTTPRLKPGRWG